MYLASKVHRYAVLLVGLMLITVKYTRSAPTLRITCEKMLNVLKMTTDLTTDCFSLETSLFAFKHVKIENITVNTIGTA